MSKYSGYDALYHHLPSDFSIDSVFCDFRKIYRRGIGRLFSVIARFISPSGFYAAQSVEAETALLLKSRKQKYHLIHYSYGEPYWGLAATFKRWIKSPTVVTNHQPAAWWDANQALFKRYQKVDKVITLSAYDRDYFNTHLPGKAVYIPHGVDTDFFRPAELKLQSSTFKVIFAGRYLRDIPTLAAVIKTLSATNLDIQFDLVVAANEPDLKGIAALPNVNFHTDVADGLLLSLYQQAHCCLIPLLDCTANNAILEAMACRLPVVTTDLPAVKSYLDDTCAFFGKRQSAGDLVEAINTLYNTPDLLDEMGKAARTKALTQFSWTVIGPATARLFKSLT